jgi:hypothetical protein
MPKFFRRPFKRTPDSNQEPSSAVDKDFLEHLRTVHFTLLAACLGLLVVVFSPPKSETEVAHQQIRDIVEITRTWDSAFLDNAAVNELKGAKNEFCNPLDGSPTSRLPKAVEINGKRYNTKFHPRAWGFEVVDTTRGQPLGSGDDGAIEARKPESLADFHKLWDRLKDHQIGWGCGSLTGEAWYEDWSSGPVHRLINWQAVDASRSYPTVELEYGPFLAEEHSDIAQTLRDKFVRHAFSTLDLKQQRVSLFVATEVPVVLVDGQAILIARYPDRWRHGLFVDAFYELNKITSDYQDISLDGIERIARAEADRSRESLEAFGVKFPVETASRWGLFIIISVQLYFALHLAEYARLGRRETTVAWIGSYPRFTARLVFSISSFILPVLVVAFVAERTHFAGSGRVNVVIVVAVAILAAALSGAAAYSYLRGSRKSATASKP